MKNTTFKPNLSNCHRIPLKVQQHHKNRSASSSFQVGINKKKLGIVCVKNKSSISIISDGDLRRHSNNLYKKKILKISTKNPAWISEDYTALSAIEKMNSKKITSLLVARNQDINKKIKKVIGILHLHHCLSRGIK